MTQFERPEKIIGDERDGLLEDIKDESQTANSTLSDIDSDTSNIVTQTAGMAAKLDSMEADLNAIEPDVDAIKDDVAGFGTQLTSLISALQKLTNFQLDRTGGNVFVENSTGTTLTVALVPAARYFSILATVGIGTQGETSPKSSFVRLGDHYTPGSVSNWGPICVGMAPTSGAGNTASGNPLMY